MLNFLTSALDEGWGLTPSTGSFISGYDPVSIILVAVLALRPVWTGAKNVALIGIRFPDRLTRSKPIYRLQYRSPLKYDVRSTHFGKKVDHSAVRYKVESFC